MRRSLRLIAAITLATLTLGLFALSARAADQNTVYLPLVNAGATPVTAEPTPQPTPDTGDACPRGAFLSVASANSGYPAPKLSVSCTATELVVVSNGIPNFTFVQKTPNGLVAQSYTWRIPLSPTAAATPAALPLGAIGVAVNGLPIYGPMEAPAQGSADPLLDGILDSCNGHTGPRGEYHLHARPDCIFETIAGQTSLVIGYAFDGYPIMAPYVCEDAGCGSVRELRSSYVKTSDARAAFEANTYVPGAGDLDQCNGMTGADGRYRYYATTSFPYFMGCFHGQVTAATAQAAPDLAASPFICHLPGAAVAPSEPSGRS